MHAPYDGLVHLHGPRNNPCLGSNKPLLPKSVSQLTLLPDDFFRVHQRVHCNSVDNGIKLDYLTLQGAIIKHIPMSNRLHCALQLKTAIEKAVA